MLQLIETLIQAHQQQSPVSYCRLVETRGSTPQKAGAAMLVYADGSQVGTLGGGCVEAEVKRKAIGAIHSNQSALETFVLDNDYGWDDGLICGGRMQVLIEPIQPSSEIDYFIKFASCLTQGEPIIEAITLEQVTTSGNSMMPGSRLLLNNDFTILASHKTSTENQADLEQFVSLHNTQEKNASLRAWTQSGIAFLPEQKKCELLIIGGGHIGEAVSKLAASVNFEITVIDDRELFVAADRFPQAKNRICATIEEAIVNFPISSSTYAIIVTRGHQHDEEALYHLIDRGAAYLGMIGSKRKIQLIFDDLIEQGISEESLAQVFAPLGINIGSQTVPEIAISIVAELIAFRNRRAVIPGKNLPNAVIPSTFS